MNDGATSYRMRSEPTGPGAISTVHMYVLGAMLWVLSYMLGVRVQVLHIQTPICWV